MSLRRWLGLSDESAGSDFQGLEEIEGALERIEPAAARFIACFAYILARVARADHQVTAEESAEMARIVGDRASLPPAQAALVVKLATARGVRHGGTEDFLVSREFVRISDREQRLSLLGCLFELSSSDRNIVTLEDNEVRRISSELKLEHADFIAARAAYAEHLKVLRRRDP